MTKIRSLLLVACSFLAVSCRGLVRRAGSCRSRYGPSKLSRRPLLRRRLRAVLAGRLRVWNALQQSDQGMERHLRVAATYTGLRMDP